MRGGSFISSPSESYPASRVIKARWIFPLSSRPINGGWIWLRDDTIVEVGAGDPPGDAVDLGDVAVFPGLINAHTHLEFSDCRQPIGRPGMPLWQWIGQVMEARAEVSPSGKQAAIEMGMAESRQSGVRLLGEITTPPCEYSTNSGSVEVVTFAEVLGLSDQRNAERRQAAEEHNRRFSHAAWSPHAPYSTPIETIQWCIKQSQASGRMLAMHVAESPAERELLVTGGGPFADSLKQIGVWRDNLFPWNANPFEWFIDQLAAAPRALLVHGNDFRADEIQRISKSPHLSVVYCPRTHAFFGYDAHPVAEMIRRGVRVVLGTDSRASNPDLNLWREVQYLLRHRQDISPEQVLLMATSWGAEAMGRSDLGRLQPGCRPGLVCLPTAATDIEGVFADCAQNDLIET